MKAKRPQDLVFTLFGEYLFDRKKPVWVGSLISLLRPFGLSEGAVRTVLSRMTRKGWLRSKRSGRHSYYALTPRGYRLLAEGRDRIFRPPPADAWDGQWYLVTYSIPEDVRHLRDQLRVRLAWLGFGSLGNGVWISPHDVHDRVMEMARYMNIENNLLCFRAQQLGEIDHRDLVARSWDLDALARRYEAFLHRWHPCLHRYHTQSGRNSSNVGQCFVDRFNLIHEFRSFPLDDPFLPQRLLPTSWPGHDAAALSNELHDLLEQPAEQHVQTTLDATPPPVTRAPAH